MRGSLGARGFAGAALATGAALGGDAPILEHVVAPLGLEGVLGSARQLEAAGVRLRELAAPTEVVPFRDDVDASGAVRGRVHDENAWALDPEGVRQRAAREMQDTARAAARLGVGVVTGFTGSSV